MSSSSEKQVKQVLQAAAGVIVVSASFGCGSKKAAPIPAADPATVAAAIDPSLSSPPIPRNGKNGWDAMVKVVSASSHPKEDLDLMGNAASANLKPDVLKTGGEKVNGFKDDIAKLQACLGEPQWLAPVRAGYNAPTKLLDSQRGIVSAMCFRGRIRLATKAAGGADDLVSALQVADRMVRCDGCLEEVKAGLAERAFALRAIQQAAIGDSFSDPDLAKLADALSKDQDPAEVPANTLKHEFAQVFAPAVSKVTYGVPASGLDDAGLGIAPIMPAIEEILGANPNALDRAGTMKDGTPVFTALVENAKRPWSAQKPTEPIVKGYGEGWPSGLLKQEPVGDEEVSRSKEAFKDSHNPFGRFLLVLETPIWNGFFQTWFTTKASLQATRVIVAADQYRHAHAGVLPTGLAQLALSPTAIDPYADKPFSYDASRKLFWSVGPNKADDGGKDKPGFLLGGKDLVYLMPGTGGYN